MKRMLATLAALQLCLVLSNTTFAQTSNASVGGFVQDPSGAYKDGRYAIGIGSTTLVNPDITPTFRGW